MKYREVERRWKVRGFLGALAAAAVLDPERLLWVPGRKMISIPKDRRVWLNAGDTVSVQINEARPHVITMLIDENLLYVRQFPLAMHWCNTSEAVYVAPRRGCIESVKLSDREKGARSFRSRRLIAKHRTLNSGMLGQIQPGAPILFTCGLVAGQRPLKAADVCSNHTG